MSAETALMALAVGAYLLDSALLLFGNEALLTARGARGWRIDFGSGFQLLGRELLLPSPLAPHRPAYRLHWSLAARPGGDPAWTEQRAQLRFLAPWVWAMAAALFVLLPIGLYTRLGERMLLAALILLYASIAIALACVARVRARIGVSRWRLAALAFEALVCPPLAVNLVRKLSAALPVKEDLVSAARRLLAPEDWARARAALASRLDAEIDAEEQDSPRAPALRKLRDGL